MDALSGETHEAVAVLMHCHAHCTMTASTTLLEGAGTPQHIRLVQDAAAIALATADALSRKSQFGSQFAQLCIAICTTCAETCEKQAGTRECGQICRVAAQACAGLDVPEKAEVLAMASRLPP